MSADIKIFTDDIEGQALDQCHTIAKSPVFATARIRIMPDVHAGKGCVIGFTATGMTKLIPNLVGVDIGCGMLTARLDTDDLDLAKLDRLIAQKVPAGFDVHDHEVAKAQSYLDELICRDRTHRAHAQARLQLQGTLNKCGDVAESPRQTAFTATFRPLSARLLTADG